MAKDIHWPEADAMHSHLVGRADALMGCAEYSPEEEELRALTEVIETYEARRWPSGKAAGGKG
jgi:hypothetical protein